MLQYVIRQFFKCADVNGCVFVELFFRKVHESNKTALLESHTSEFAAILDNYEDEGYKRILERMKAGETLDAMRVKHKAALEGTLPWTAEEDDVLRERHPLYADHPLCCELLAAELPEDSRRTARHVRKRLQELGLVETPGRLGDRASNAGGVTLEIESNVGDSQQDIPPSPKKQRTSGQAGTDGLSQRTDDETLEMDLERLLDAAMDAEGDTLQDTVMQAAPTASAAAGSGSQGGEGGQDTLDLENELEAMLEEERTLEQQAGGGAAAASTPRSQGQVFPPAASQPQAPSQETPQRAGRMGSSQSSEFHLENELEAMMTTGSRHGADNDLAATPQGQPPTCSQDMEVEGAAMSTSVERLRQVATPQSAVSSVANLERDLEAVMEGAADDIASQPHASAGNGNAPEPVGAAASRDSQVAPGDDSGEFWDEVMRHGTPAHNEATQRPQRSQESAPTPAVNGDDSEIFWDEVMRHATPADHSATQPQQQQQSQTPQRGEEVAGSQATMASQQLEFELERIMDEEDPATPRPTQ